MQPCEIVIADFEYMSLPGELPTPVCLVAYELLSGRVWRLWQDELFELGAAPYPTDSQSLFVAYYASAELSCHLALGWALPERILDLYVEFRSLTNGREHTAGDGLLGALNWFGLDGLAAEEKDKNRRLVMDGGPWCVEERQQILKYCESDVLAVSKLLPRMLPHINMPQALIRGQFMGAVAHIEHTGIPIDVEALSILRSSWFNIQQALIEEIDSEFKVYEGRTFKMERWKRWIADHKIPWPHLHSGQLKLDEETFGEMAKLYPEISPLRDLRYCLSQLRLSDLAVGSDGRNRTLLSPFRAKTSRSQPSTSKFIFGPAVWLRGLIRPKLSYALAYIDYSQQEFGIGAALSQDTAMIQAYQSEDPYLAFGKQVGAIPSDGTKESHSVLREQFKQCALAVQYGMGANSLAIRIKRSVSEASQLLGWHRDTYQRFWDWSDRALDFAQLDGYLETVFGWRIYIGPKGKDRTLRNFPMQANGAEMLRLACCEAIQEGVSICAPIHDAVLIEAPIEDIEESIRKTVKAMIKASQIVLNGFELRTDTRVVCYPNRYEDPRGQAMWERVWKIVHKNLGVESCIAGETPSVGTCITSATQPVSPLIHPSHLISYI